MGAGLHRAVASGGGRELRAEHVAVAADHSRRVPRAGVFDDGIAAMVGDDAVHDGSGSGIAVLRSANDWGGSGRAEFLDGAILGMGAFHGPAAGAGEGG